ncbi:MAG: hypothetical protein HWD61_11475 [Parachlamydiaceae bacterium]|nr:MAG: hypothetical protein HWD61_11475 [Parachlamydiaceae bacterium]
MIRKKENETQYLQILIGGVVFGLAIVSMHYTGMSAMTDVQITYWPGLFFSLF